MIILFVQHIVFETTRHVISMGMSCMFFDVAVWQKRFHHFYGFSVHTRVRTAETENRKIPLAKYT